MREASPPMMPVASITVLAAVLRFLTLDAKGFWQDEGNTVLLLDHGFAKAMSTFSEHTPPLYYALAWVWTRVFGLSEAGVRSLSALAGTAVVPVVYLAARDLLSRRAGLIAAALAAVSPPLVWFSQDARPYALFTLTVALSLLFFVRALQRRTRALGWWAVSSAFMVATHYFGAYIVAAEGLMLLSVRRDELRRVALAIAPSLLTVGALTPLIVKQVREDPPSSWIAVLGLPGRIAEVAPSWIVGFQAPHLLLAAGIGGALTAYGLWLLIRRGDARERRAAGVLLAVAAASALMPLGLALVGVDFFYYRQLVGGAVFVLVALAAGFGARSAGAPGLAGAGALLALSLAIVLATSWQPKFNREDWRGAVRSLGGRASARALVVTPKSGDPPVSWYADAGEMPARGASVREVDVIGGARNKLGALGGAHTPRPAAIVSPALGFRLVARREGRLYTTLRFVTGRPVAVKPAQLARARIDDTDVAVLITR